MITYEQIAKVSAELKLTPIKGKDYATVNQRVKAFRKCFPDGSIETCIVTYEDGLVIMQATVRDGDGKLLATGTSYEREGSSMINKTSFIENCETSAVGRALGFLGIGIEAGVASADEMQTALEKQTSTTTEAPTPYKPLIASEPLVYQPKPKKQRNVSAQCQRCLKDLEPTENKSGEMMSVADLVDYSKSMFDGRILCPDCMRAEKERLKEANKK